MSIKSRILKKLNDSINIGFLDVIDESDKHIGHVGHDSNGDSHFKIIIKSDDFNNMNRVKIHRLIYNILDEEIKDGVHALAIKASVS